MTCPLSLPQMKDFLHAEILAMIYSAGDQDQMMEESAEAAQRREEMIRMYHTCKEALQLISEVSTRTGEGHNPKAAYSTVWSVTLATVILISLLPQCKLPFLLLSRAEGMNRSPLLPP